MAFRKPNRLFENSGLVNPETSYYVRLENVVNTNNQDIKTMVDRGRYFSIFAPRQSGKTTFLDGMRRELHRDPTYVVILLSFERFSELDKNQFYRLIEESLYRQLIDRLREVNCDKAEAVEQCLDRFQLNSHVSFGSLFNELNRIIQLKKIVIFIDEFDGIPLSELGNFLTALRDLYQQYKMVKQKALYSVGLIGIRNITKLVVGGVSPFNIADQVEMPPFSLKNIHDLYAQYTEETNQPFTEGAVKKVHAETSGQTWLVNRLGTILTIDIKPGTTEPIEETDVDTAIQMLLKERNVHFDNLYEKVKLFKETFVKIVFNNVTYNPDDEDQTWLEQYGLVRNRDAKAIVANSVYKQRYLETLFREIDVAEEVSPSDYLLPDQRLDMGNILLDFEQYIMQIGAGAFYQKEKPYEKTGQFLLTAWLYQFVKGGAGELRFEVRSGLGRMDVLLTYKGKKYIIETKVNHRELKRTIDQGVAQVSRKYLASESCHEGYLVIFDVKTPVGESHKPQHHEAGGKILTSFIIGIGRTD